MKRTAFILIVVFLTICNAAWANEDFSGQYICTEEVAGGITLDRSAKKWRGGSFKANDKFIVTLKRHGTKTGKTKEFPTYTVTLKDHGTLRDANCWADNIATDNAVIMHSGGRFNCNRTLVGDYFFNLSTLRFLYINTEGYVDGDEDDRTPGVVAGVCTRLN